MHLIAGHGSPGAAPAAPDLARRLRLALLLLALPALLGLGTGVAAPASASVPTFVDAVNSERRARGLAALVPAGDLGAVAQRWSQQMADRGVLSHNPELGSQVTGWRAVGENVGRGGSELQVHNALMASPGHRENILHTAYTEVGIGIVARGGTVWVTQVFRQPTGPTAVPTEFRKAGYSPTIYAVQGTSHRAATFEEWAAAGYPAPRPTDTWYVRYPWSGSISAVTFWPGPWQWDRLDPGSWAAAGHPTPRIAGWIHGSTIWKRASGPAIHLTDPSGLTHQLTYEEWAAAEFRAPQVR
jgi:hypothetical protein